MTEVVCEVCGRKIDSRGMSGHMKSHVAKQDDGHESGVISYPSNEQKTGKTDTVVVLDESQGKPVKKQVVSKPVSSPANKPDTRGQRNSGSKSTGHPKDSGVTETEHKKEWQGLFRE